MDAKSNEIAAVRDLMKAFTDLAGAVIMIDALHTQAEQAVTSVKGTSGDLARIRRMTSQRGSTGGRSAKTAHRGYLRPDARHQPASQPGPGADAARLWAGARIGVPGWLPVPV